MFNEIVLDALHSRDAKLAKLKDGNYEKIVAEAISRWVVFDPKGQECRSAGVDSSWNKRALQGLDLYVIAAVAVTSSNEILAKEWDNDVSGSARGDQLEGKAMEMEMSVAQKARNSSKTDIVCVDGSIISRLLRSTPAEVSKAVEQYGNSIFISKTSESRAQFGFLGSRAGDVYYYRHACGGKAGYSTPIETPFRDLAVIEIYARLREGMPLLRIELLKSIWETPSEHEIKKVLSLLRYHSVAGYPYCLKLAHKTCKISNDDIDRLASIYSLQNEQGSRDALNE